MKKLIIILFWKLMRITERFRRSREIRQLKRLDEQRKEMFYIINKKYWR